MIIENKINAKVCSDLFYDTVLLNRDYSIIVEFLHKELKELKSTYINSHTLYNIINSCSKIKENNKFL